MKRGSTKKGPERRRKARSPRGSKSASSSVPRKEPAENTRPEELCSHCSKGLESADRALFVEEEVGRVFCSEDCITGYFAPEIERLEKEYFRRLSPGDLSASERDNLAHLRWITLQEPDEVWREKTLSGDYRYTLISEFEPGSKKVWSICICLFLRGEPSFLYLAFPTRNAAMVNQYRRGEQIEWAPQGAIQGKPRGLGGAEMAPSEPEAAEPLSDRLADAWTEDETYRAQMSQERSRDDIPAEDYGLYQGCIEETLETPDEVWSLRAGGEDSPKLYHFIRHYPEEKPGVWYVIVARELESQENASGEEEDQIEILDAFPTRDSQLVNRYRTGEQEIGETTMESRAVSRVVH